MLKWHRLFYKYSQYFTVIVSISNINIKIKSIWIKSIYLFIDISSISNIQHHPIGWGHPPLWRPWPWPRRAPGPTELVWSSAWSFLKNLETQHGQTWEKQHRTYGKSWQLLGFQNVACHCPNQNCSPPKKAGLPQLCHLVQWFQLKKQLHQAAKQL